MFLGDKTRSMSKDQPFDRTYVAFHSKYANDGGRIKARIAALKPWVVKYSDSKADPDLVGQLVNPENRNRLICFYHHQASIKTRSHRVLICEGDEDPEVRLQIEQLGQTPIKACPWPANLSPFSENSRRYATCRLS